MAKHRFDELEDGVRWGGPALLEKSNAATHHHGRANDEHADSERFASRRRLGRLKLLGSMRFRPPPPGNLGV